MYQIIGIKPLPYPNPDLCNLFGNGHEPALFFYHPDHLGSTGMVTDNNATVTQGFLYTPFGELLYEYSPGWQSGIIPKYSFNAKELDEENGMYYYSARYYAPPTFISRDEKFEEFPTISPYSYCKGNPVILVDPDGRANSKDPPWKQINSVIQKEKFVGFREGAQCLDLAKEQLNVVGYTCGSYYESTTHRVYTEQKGVNETETAKAIQYIHDALEQGIPVLAGVDNSPGHPGNHDETTDHFIVIVGQGSEDGRNYFLFYDNSTRYQVNGTSENNKLYYDSKDGKITGTSETFYSINSQRDYTITHVRESRALKQKENN
jgi:RHS repeat-associated protein